MTNKGLPVVLVPISPSIESTARGDGRWKMGAKYRRGGRKIPAQENQLDLRRWSLGGQGLGHQEFQLPNLILRSP
jgi:hypothetical protein